MVTSSLLVAVSAQVVCQLYKVFVASIRRGRFEVAPFFTTGGMPSAHSAFVSALTAAVGMQAGVTSDLFAVSAVFSLIVIYDAYRLRGEVAKHAVILNGLASPSQLPEGKPLNEAVGHSLGEIVAGLLVGVFWAVGILLLFGVGAS